MKKLVFAVIATVAMVSVSNVFASNKMAQVTDVEPTDSVAPADTTSNETADSTLSLQTEPSVDSTVVNPTATVE